MNQTISPGARTGSVCIPASKSQAHRLLICAALGAQPVALRCDGISADIAATVRCLRALGADITDDGAGTLRVVPIAGEMPEHADLLCGESGSTLRFLLPVAGALGADVTFHMQGRLPQRPLAPLDAVLTAHGIIIGKIFCHPLGKGSDQYFVTFFCFFVYLSDQIIDLSFYRTDFYFRVQKSCWTDDLFCTKKFMFCLILSRGGRYEHYLIQFVFKFIKA